MLLFNQVLAEISINPVINQESREILVHLLKFRNFPRFTREISKISKGELGKFIPNFPQNHVITSTNTEVFST